MLHFELTGIDEAKANLQRLVAPVNDDRVSDHAVAALEPVAEMARNLAPVDSGDLRDSIVVSTNIKAEGTDGRSVQVGPLGAGASSGAEDVFYAHFLEYGTVFQRAQPFMAPAVHYHRELIFDTLAMRIAKDMTGAL